MASLRLFISPIPGPQRRVKTAATAAKSSSGASQEKGPLDFIWGALQKQDQFYETDPILKKVEEKSGGSAKGGTITIPPKKKDGGNDGGFGLGGLTGLFAKK